MLLAGPNFQRKTSYHSRGFSSGIAAETHPPSKHEEVNVNGFKMSAALDIWKSNFVSNSGCGFIFASYVTFLQIVTDIVVKCNNYFIRKCKKCLLQNVTIFLNYKMQQFYYKMR